MLGFWHNRIYKPKSKDGFRPLGFVLYPSLQCMVQEEVWYFLVMMMHLSHACLIFYFLFIYFYEGGICFWSIIFPLKTEHTLYSSLTPLLVATSNINVDIRYSFVFHALRAPFSPHPPPPPPQKN